jgi:hypothetical protein
MCDRLNTHLSAGVIRLVAGRCGITDDPGERGKSGVLAFMKGRPLTVLASRHGRRAEPGFDFGRGVLARAGRAA